MSSDSASPAAPGTPRLRVRVNLLIAKLPKPGGVFRILRVLLFVLILLTTPFIAHASVTLVSFEASEENDWVRLDWETATEIDNAAFFLRRSTTGGGSPTNYALIPVIDVITGEEVTFIPAKGDGLVGATYAYYDQNVTSGSTFYYLLEAVDYNNFSEFHGPITITLGASNVTPSITPTSTTSPTPSQTPSPTPTGSQTITLTPTSTPTLTPSQTPTTGPTATRTPTIPPTIPPLATVTPSPTITFTPGPSLTPTETPTVTPTASVTLHPLDLTLTAVLAIVTPYPTYTPLPPTRTPFPTWTAIPTNTSPPNPLEGIETSSLMGLTMTFCFITASGLVFAGFLSFYSRKSQDE